MSRHWRFCGSAFLLFAGLSTLPAFSNPLTDLLNPAPKEDAAPAAAPAPVREQCPQRPGRSAAPGQHWFYRLDGNRKCWFQAPEEHASGKRKLYHHAAEQPVAPEENEAAPRKKRVVDARAQLLSAAPSDESQPAPPTPEVVDTASAPPNGAATLVPAAPVVAALTIDQLKSHATRRPVDVEMLLAAEVPLAKDAVASSAPPVASPAPSSPDADKDRWGSMATQAGMMLIVLGLVSVLAGLLRAGRFREPSVAAIRQA